MLEKIGKYEVSEQIGVGGFGAVYRGRDPFIKRTVAIKTCQVNDDEIKHRFFREAELAGNLHHRNITTIYDFGVENGIPYIVQEFLTGEDLDKKIKRADPILVARKIEILMAIADGLAYAHNASIVHRDVKPANVRVLDDGTVKVMDFGIAKSLQTESNLTQTGITLGTSAYLAPEQIRGEPIDRRTDIFSMGVLSYELLSYRKPFRGEHLSTVLYKILNDTPEPLESLSPDLPPALIAAVNRAISKSPVERYQTMEDYRQDLHAVFRELTGSSGMYMRSLMLDAARPTRAGADETDTTLATPSSGVGIPPPAHITPPSGALARQPAASSDKTPTSGGMRPPLELVNFRDPLADTIVDEAAPTVRRSSPSAVRTQKKGDSKILSIVALVVSVAAGVFLWMRRSEQAAPKAPPPPPAAAAPTPALEFPEPKLGAGAGVGGAPGEAAAPAGSQTQAQQSLPVPTAASAAAAGVPAAAQGTSTETAPVTSTAGGPAAAPPSTNAPSAATGAAGALAPAAPAAAAAPEKPPAQLKKYKVQFSSVPLATLSVDGKTIGPSVPARTISLEEGSHKVRFEAKGFPVHEQTFKVGSDAENRVHYQFPISMLVIDAPAWKGARLLVDGKYRGNLPEVSPLRLPPGSYSLTLSREGTSPVTEKIRVPEGAEKTWSPPPPSPAASGGAP
jgi:serine/threonine protein kinase